MQRAARDVASSLTGLVALLTSFSPLLPSPLLPAPSRSYIIGLFLAPAIQSLCENQNNFLLYSIGTRMRNSLMAAIYRKCLRLSNSALQVGPRGAWMGLCGGYAAGNETCITSVYRLELRGQLSARLC